MRETRADLQRAVVFALLLHLLPLGVLWVATLLGRGGERVSVAGEPVSAEMLDHDALSPTMRRALARAPVPLAESTPPAAQASPPDPMPEPLEETPPPLPQQLQPQEMLADPDPQSREEVRADAQSAQTAEREQDAQQRQGQVDLTADRKRQREEERRRLESEQDRQRQDQIAELRRRRALNDQAIARANENLARMAQQNAQNASRDQSLENRAGGGPPAGNRGQDNDPRARWIAEMLARIEGQWIRPDNVRVGVRCPIRIRLLAGGYVDSAEVQPGCPYDEIAKRSVEAAVMKASPMPYRGFEDVYVRDLTVNFIAP